ncbi:hypothetical protein [Methylosinus sp. KRF6]|uniref:hypothetical protein n=1 Tax=Methylosinus sp. KRF6 TaxID=2846853 RepID=UPI001C0D21AA|nr:hypothetical protein [Methylosinus sp. KRF6]MBU3887628.1 hypothetical protein [Methylosinus sp. KRF6]
MGACQDRRTAPLDLPGSGLNAKTPPWADDGSVFRLSRFYAGTQMNTTSADLLQERRALFIAKVIQSFIKTPHLYECRDAVESTIAKTFGRLRLLEFGHRPGPNDNPFRGPRYSRLPLAERERIVLDLYAALDDIDLPIDDAEDVAIDALVALVS